MDGNALETLGTAAAAEMAASGLGARRAPVACANCGTAITHEFCPACGQGVKDQSRSLRVLVGEVVENVLNLESRTVRTLGALLFRPGRLTADYISGRRARYIPPVRLYLFITLVFFLLLSLTNVALFVVKLIPAGDVGVGVSVTFSPQDGPQILGAEAVEGAELGFFVDLDGWTNPVKIDAAGLDRLFAAQPDTPEWAKRATKGMVLSLDDPRNLNRVMSDNLVTLMVVLMPFYAVLLALLYRRQRRYLIDHVAMSLHIHTFLFAALVPAILMEQYLAGGLDAVGRPWVALAWFGSAALYVWIALRKVYGQGGFKTTAKWLVLGTVYLGVAATGLFGLLILSLPEV